MADFLNDTFTDSAQDLSTHAEDGAWTYHPSGNSAIVIADAPQGNKIRKDSANGPGVAVSAKTPPGPNYEVIIDTSSASPVSQNVGVFSRLRPSTYFGYLVSSQGKLYYVQNGAYREFASWSPSGTRFKIVSTNQHRAYEWNGSAWVLRGTCRINNAAAAGSAGVYLYRTSTDSDGRYIDNISAAPVVPTGESIVVCDGDSRTAGVGTTGDLYRYPEVLALTELGAPWCLYNAGVSGQTTGQMNTDCATELVPLASTLNNSNIAVLLGGTNDITGLVAAATIYSNLLAECATLKAAGFTVVILTVDPRSTNSEALETVRTTLNASIVGGAAANGYFVFDLAGATHFETIADTSDATYYSDGTHWTDAGAALVAGHVADTILAIPPQPSKANVSTDGLTLTLYCNTQNGALQASGSVTGFSVSGGKTISSVSLTDDHTVEIVVASPYLDGDTVTVSYSQSTGNVTDTAGSPLELAAFTDFAVTNNSEVTVVAPTVTTAAASSITATSAKSGGTSLDDDSIGILEQGICWNTTGTPDIDDDSIAAFGTTAGAYICTLPGLTENTVYYIRAYLTYTGDVTVYGSQVTFRTAVARLSPVQDALDAVGSAESGNQVVYIDPGNHPVDWALGLEISFPGDAADVVLKTGSTSGVVMIGPAGYIALQQKVSY